MAIFDPAQIDQMRREFEAQSGVRQAMLNQGLRSRYGGAAPSMLDFMQGQQFGLLDPMFQIRGLMDPEGFGKEQSFGDYANQNQNPTTAMLRSLLSTATGSADYKNPQSMLGGAASNPAQGFSWALDATAPDVHPLFRSAFQRAAQNRFHQGLVDNPEQDFLTNFVNRGYKFF